MQLTELMNELAEQRRAEPDRRPHLRARPQRPRRGHARARARSRRSSSSSRWPATTPPAPRSATACTCSPQNPDQRQDLAGRPRRRHRRPRSRRSCGSRRRSRSCAAPSPTTRRCRRPRLRGGRQGRPLLRRRQPRPAGVRRPRALRRAPRPEPARRLRRARARTSASAPTSPGASCRSSFRQLLTRLPDIEVTGDPVPLEALGIPLVGGIKHLPVRFTPDRRGSARPDVATPTAWDEQFVHQIPELLTERRQPPPVLAGELLLRHPRPGRRGRRRVLHDGALPGPTSAWTRCRWAGSAASS